MPKTSERYHLDPAVHAPRVGDIVLLSQYKIQWHVKHNLYGQLYLRSVVGGRFAEVVSSRVTQIWRDPSIKPVRDNTLDYGDIYEDADYDWSIEDDDDES